MSAPIVGRRGSAGALHALAMPEPATLEVWVFEVERTALALGSGQSAEVVDVTACRRDGVEVVRRRSGGGAVLVEPGAIVWFDVIVPATRLRAEGIGDDVGRSMVWMGERIAAALRAVGVAEPSVHRGRSASTPWSPLVCFAGVGPGEVLLEGRKLVGISQRRTRAGSRFQCAIHGLWSPQLLHDLLLARPSELPPVAILPAAVAAAVPAALAGLIAD